FEGRSHRWSRLLRGILFRQCSRASGGQGSGGKFVIGELDQCHGTGCSRGQTVRVHRRLSYLYVVFAGCAPTSVKSHSGNSVCMGLPSQVSKLSTWRTISLALHSNNKGMLLWSLKTREFYLRTS